MIRRLIVILFLMYSSSCFPADMNFHGALNAPPPCTINSGNEIDVDFGSTIGVNKINGINYLEPVNYKIMCGDEASAGTVTLTFSGLKTDFDDSAVKTNVTGLGVRILEDGLPIIFDKSVPVTLDSPPVLEAVPVKDNNIALKEGPFEAVATLRAEYQ